jgi:hypothetical protein
MDRIFQKVGEEVHFTSALATTKVGPKRRLNKPPQKGSLNHSY